MEFKAIGHIRTGFPEKFGIPRQSGLVATPGYIELDEPYSDANAVRGLEDFSHLWLIWLASENVNADGSWDWQPTARPPRLGGNERKGIFATRSPFHPNLIGMSCVKLERIEAGRIYISGADVLDGTPLLDIKPYITYSDSIPDAKSGYAQGPEVGLLKVEWPEGLELKGTSLENSHLDDGLEDELDNSIDLSSIPREDLELISQILAQNPRPHYQDDPERVYGMSYGSYEVKFKIQEGTALVISIKSRY